MDAQQHEDRRREIETAHPIFDETCDAGQPPVQPNRFEQKTWEPSNGEVAWTYDDVIAREA